MPSKTILLLGTLLLAAGTAFAGDRASPCRPCLVFDRLDKQIRDGLLTQPEARRQFAAHIAELDVFLAPTTPSQPPAGRWIFPLQGYTLPVAGAEAAKGYLATGYDYFDGNRHGGHPSFDLFIADRNQDSRDDRSGKPVTIVSMTGGIVVAAEPAWTTGSTLRGGKYLWIYEPGERRLLYYAHTHDLLVGVGERVEPGTPIATVGRSGFNAAKQRSPTHLHLTVLQIRDGRPQPENVLSRLRASFPLP